MGSGSRGPAGPPEIDLSDPAVVRDPFTAYGKARERAPVARMLIPGMAPMWVMTRHESARAMLSDPRFELRSESYLRPDVPEDCLPYMRTLGEMNGSEHARLRRLVAPAFTARRTAEFRPRIESLVTALLDELPDRAEDGRVDLVRHFTRPLPMDVICELVGIPGADRPRWREYGVAVSTGHGKGFAEAVPAIMEGAKAAVARRRAEPGDDLISDLVRVHDGDGSPHLDGSPHGDAGRDGNRQGDRGTAESGNRLSDTELVALVWHLVLAGQTPANLIANAVEALLTHPAQLAALRAEPHLMPGAVQELTRWCTPQILTVPRYAREDAELHGTLIRKGEAVTASIVAANRDPRAFDAPDELDITRGTRSQAQLGFGHGPHFCLGAAPARVQTEVALAALLNRFPDLALAVDPEDVERAPDGGTWRLAALPVTL